MTTHHFQAEVSQVLKLVINSLYSHKEIFLRELVSNASDALDKLRFRALQEPDLASDAGQLRIRLIPDRDAGTLTIEDNGVGMSQEELAQNLGTIAWSGSREFMEKLSAAKSSDESLSLIGQFGVGFYSGYLVADQVEVISRAAGSSEAHRWLSDAGESFTIEPAERAEPGTSVVLHLKEDQKEFLDDWRLRELVRRYSDYVGHPIELSVTKTTGEGDDAKEETSFEVINQASALWQRPSTEVTDDQYKEFYKHLTRDFEEPAGWKHFKIEGTQLFTGLLFVPKRKPFDLFDPDAKHGVRLHVKRVFVMDQAEELLPRWLRFVRGVVDSEDLPLNVSRELLQDSKAVRVIRKQVVSQTLTLLREIAKEKETDYLELWSTYGAVLKEGLVVDEDGGKDKLIDLLRYDSTVGEAPTSLAAYVERMKEDQTAIYYAAGEDRAVLASSPHLEALKKRGYEVLLMTDPVDPFALDHLTEYDGKPLVSAANAKLDLGEDEEAEKEKREKAAPLIAKLQGILGGKVKEVVASSRLTDSPACLVTASDSMAPHLEKLMRARGMDIPAGAKVLEVNLDHPLLRSMQSILDRDGDSPQLARWMEVLHAQAQLAEGTPVDDPTRFARQIAELLSDAATREADPS